MQHFTIVFLHPMIIIENVQFTMRTSHSISNELPFFVAKKHLGLMEMSYANMYF